MAEEKIREIFEREFNKWLRCKDVIEEAKKEGISATTVYRQLREMVEKGVLEKDRKEWKNSQYRLNPQKIPIKHERLLTFKYAILEHIRGDILNNTKIKNFSEADFEKRVSEWIGALSIYTLLKETETGLPYTQAVTYCLTDFAGLLTVIRRAIVLTETPFIRMEENPKAFHPAELLPKEYKAAVNRFKSALKTIFETQFKAIEKIDKDVEGDRIALITVPYRVSKEFVLTPDRKIREVKKEGE